MAIKFNDLLACIPGFGKDAAVESPDSGGTELDFGRMAHTFVMDKAPGLAKYMLGFEIVDKSDDESRLIGIFGFKVADDYFYVPAFFINNQVTGIEFLYMKRSNSFVPLTEGWIDSVVSRQSMRLGGPAPDARKVREDFSTPDFTLLSEPPGVKHADTVIGFAETAPEVWNEIQRSMVEMIGKDAAFQNAWAGFAGAAAGGNVIEKTADGSSLVEFMRLTRDPRVIEALLNTVGTDIKFASAALSFYPSVESLAPSVEPLPVKSASRITVETEVGDYVDGKYRHRLVRDGFAITDTRKPSEKSEIYEADLSSMYSSPSEPGVYDILLRGGGTASALVVPCGDRACIIHKQLDEPVSARLKDVLVRSDKPVDTDGLSSYTIKPEDMKPGGEYLLLHDSSGFAGAYRVRAATIENDRRVRMSVSQSWRFRDESPASRSESVNTIELTGARGRVSVSGSTLRVPSNCRAVEIDKPAHMRENDGDKPLGCCAPDSCATSPLAAEFQPGSLNDLMFSLYKGANCHSLVVGCADGNEYDFRLDDMHDVSGAGYKTAMCRLVGVYRLSVDDAESILKEAREKFKSRKLVKIGQMVGVNMPQMPIPPVGIDPATGGGMMQMPYEASVPGQTVGAPPPGDGWDPYNATYQQPMGSDAAQLADMAARTGQKQVFDHAAIGGLSQLFDVGDVIDTYIPKLMVSLDHLGRVLFLYYWKNDDFTERYGRADMPEMEDTLKGTFRRFGDLILKLRERSVEQGSQQEALLE
jgi:hypothetical protein